MMYRIAAISLVPLILIVSPTRLTAQLSAAQQPGKGTLIVQCTPGGAQVYVDDALMGTTSAQGRLSLSLSPDKHSLRISLKGYADWNGSTTLAAGHTVLKRAVLNPARGTDGRSARSDRPSLEDTLAFVAGKVSAYPVEFFTGNSDATVDRKRSTTLRYAGCTVSLHAEDHELLAGHDALGRSDCSVPLNKINLPIAIKNVDESNWGKVASGNPKYYRITLRTQLDEPLIRCSNHYENPLPNNPNTSDSQTNNSTVGMAVSDQDVANRVAAALSHAVRLCGGGEKKEPF